DMNDFFIIAAIAPGDWKEALADLNAAQRARANLVINFARHVQGIEVVDLASPPPSTGPAPSTGTPAEGTPTAAALSDGVTKNAIKVNRMFDQGCRLEFFPCAPQDIAKMRARWQTSMWVALGKHVNPSDAQLSVLKRLQDLDRNMFAFDMGVWGPFGARRERHFMLTMHRLSAAGTYQAKERGVADAYACNSKVMAKNYPNAWWICCMAEWELWCEFAVEEIARQRHFYEQNPTLSMHDPRMPWTSVPLAGIKGVDAMQFWESSLKEKARNWMTTQRASTHPSWCDRQANLYSPPRMAAATAAAPPPQRQQQPANVTRRARKRRAAEARVASGSQSGELGARSSGAQTVDYDARRADGQYYFSKNGVALCYHWGRNPGA
ncbi:unnamed protein product, partial [Prorocentrum cordatum]